MLFDLPGWFVSKDGDPEAYALFRRHYSARKTAPKVRQFIGPGEKMVLVAADYSALFCWRRCNFWDDGQIGVNCTVFRNEGPGRASEMIREAEGFAWERWPGQRLFTFVDGSKVKGTCPGYCFRRAGWKSAGFSKGGLLILEKLP